MKYIASGKQTVYPEDYKTKVDFLRRSEQWLKEKTAEGIVECAYSYPTGGGFIIFNADSHEEMARQLVDFPLFPLCEFNVQPILDFADNAEITIGEFGKLGVYDYD